MTADSVVCICLHAECENDEIAELANERENCNDASDPGISVHLMSSVHVFIKQRCVNRDGFLFYARNVSSLVLFNFDRFDLLNSCCLQRLLDPGRLLRSLQQVKEICSLLSFKVLRAGRKQANAQQTIGSCRISVFCSDSHRVRRFGIVVQDQSSASS